MGGLIYESGDGQTALPDDGLKGANPDFAVIGDGHCDRGGIQALLHDDVAAALAHILKAITGKDFADFRSGKDRQLRQW